MRWILAILCCYMSALHADTIDHYMSIADNIPKMEIKADEQSQAWARSARHVLTITCESIAETITQANSMALAQGKPIFCLPQDTKLDAKTMNELIVQTYRDLSSQQSDKNTMTVSQIAWLGVSKTYPCQASNAGKQLLHAVAAPGSQ